jgi:hypothetical protein
LPVNAVERLVSCLAIALSACAPLPSSPSLLRGQPVKKPIGVMLQLSPEVRETDGSTGGDAIVNALTDELDERSLQWEYYSRSVPPAPSIQISVEKWDAGDVDNRSGAAFLGGLIAQAALAGEYVVLCKIYRDGETEPAFEKRYQGAIMGTSDTASADTGSALGSTIAWAAFGNDNEEDPTVR